ncbi:MAG: YihY/virulence factor BrkB family protein [Marmoricola sp.]|nr:YihY/virulence factor BrkB family protein [Marmoricola sp.]
MGVVGAVDRTQRRHPVLGLPLAVLYKFFDDQGNYLAATMTYYGFVAIFPLLLLATSILGFLFQGSESVRTWVVESTLRNFPIVGDQLGTPAGLQGSVGAVVVGGLIALYGAMGLGQSIQNAMFVVWSVPRNSRPNPVKLRVKSLLLLLFSGLALVTITAVSLIGRQTDSLGQQVGPALGWLISVVNIALIALVLTFLLRLAAADGLSWKRAAPGGIFIALLWQVVQQVSASYLARMTHETSSMNKTFGLVLGIVGITFVTANIGVLGMELNVVLARRLWPRALLTPFTDEVELTHADREAYTSYARAQRHKGFEQVTVNFEDTVEPQSTKDDQDDHDDRGDHDDRDAEQKGRR